MTDLEKVTAKRDLLLEDICIVAKSLRSAGANIPAPENKGTAESAINRGLSIALLLIEDVIKKHKDIQNA